MDGLTQYSFPRIPGLGLFVEFAPQPVGDAVVLAGFSSFFPPQLYLSVSPFPFFFSVLLFGCVCVFFVFFFFFLPFCL